MRSELVVNNKKIKTVVEFVGVILIYFILQLKFLNDAYFPSDEQDIMLGGKAIARGFLLYKDFLSQHMPVSYYVSAFFELLGAHTILQQRLAFWFFYAFVWAVVYKEYQDVVRKEVLFFSPICFIILIGTYADGTVVLSEHIAGIGFVILFFEFLKFINTRKLNLKSCIMISISILLTFGTIFVAVFPIFVIALGVFLKEILWWREKKESIVVFIRYLMKKYFKLVIVTGIPWVIYFIYLKTTGTLYLFYYSAYEMNRTIYPKYLGGYGSSVLSAALNLLSGFARELQGILFPVEGMSFYSVIYLVIIILAIAGILWFSDKYGILVGGICVFFVLALGSRGYFSYHGTHCVEILCMLAISTIVSVIIKSKEDFRKKGFLYRLGTYLLIVFISMPYISNLEHFSTISFKEAEDGTAIQLAQITEKNEAIWNATLWNDIFVKADRVGLYNILGVPWSWDAHGGRVLGDFNDNPPRVLLLQRDFTIWGYNLVDYGKEALVYIDEHYTCYNNSLIYIRNDYYDAAVKKLKKS